MLSALSFLGCAQNNTDKLTLKGKVPQGIERLLLVDHNEGKVMDTIKVVDGGFEYEMKRVADDVFYGIVDMTGTQTVNFVSDGSALSVDFASGKATGTPLNDTLAVMTDRIKAVSDKYADVMKQYKAETDAQKRDGLKAQLANYGKDLAAVIERTIDNNQSNCLPAYLILVAIEGIDFNKLLAYSESKAAYTKHPLFRNVMQYIDYKKPSMAFVGKKFTDVVGNDLGGKEHRLSEYVGKGNYVLVDFWASWCGPCMREMPNVKACWERYSPKGFNVVGISLDNDAGRWSKAISDGGYNWVHISDLKGWKSSAVAAYGVQAIPWNFLCDGEGTIVAVSLTGSDLERKLSEIY